MSAGGFSTGTLLRAGGMPNGAAPLLIPVENQVRELDAKLLLACIAAERGYPVFLGSRTYMHLAVSSFPRGIYLAKSIRRLSNTMFKILRLLGHKIVFWEEEALVHAEPKVFFSVRFSRKNIGLVERVFAWGEENADLFGQYPHLPDNLPIHVTGNPRGDMLRPELRAYFDEEADGLRRRYGDFILVNGNFAEVNPFMPAVGLLCAGYGGPNSMLGQAGQGMTLEYAKGLQRHKKRVLARFIEMIPFIEQAFPAMNIVLRPHPSENHEVYRRLAARCRRVAVINEGNVIPWLLAAKTLVHNGCTTGLEACALRAPAVSYLPDMNEYYDLGIQGVPTKLSHQCRSLAELQATLGRIFAGELGAAGGAERRRLLDYYLAAQDGPLACERIMDALDGAGHGEAAPPAPPLAAFICGWLYARGWGALAWLNMHRPGPNRCAYHDHRFPPLTAADVERRVARLGAVLGRFGRIAVRPHSRHLFCLEGGRPAS